MEDRFETFVGLVSSINKEVQRIKATEMGRYGLRATDVMCLYQLGRVPEGIPEAELARAVGVDRAAISRTVMRLAQEGFVERSANENGTHYRGPVRLTDKGEVVVREANERITSVVGEAGKGLSSADRAAMYRSLETILANLEEVSRD